MHMIDLSDTNCIAASEPEPLIDRASGQQRRDRDGQPLSIVRVVVFAAGDAQVLAIRVPGTPPKGIAPNTPVRVVSLTLTPWHLGDRSGLSYRAERVEALAPARPTS